jgi:uncharacterized protein involved in response to NO
MQQARTWRGPAFLSYGFRPFFFSAGVLAALLIALWTPWYLGFLMVPSALSPVNWHIHELLFGYVPAVVAGFLLTAVPNWTGRLPVVGWPLAGLFALWLLARGIVLVSPGLSPLALAAGTLLFPFALLGVMAREIIAGRNWRNLKILGPLVLITLAQISFHYEAAHSGRSEIATRLGIAATILLIMIVGGRIVPSFTRNWIKRENPGREPKAFSRFDILSMGIGGIALAGWVIAPLMSRAAIPLGIALLAAGCIQAIRLARWAPDRTLAEPLVAVLHAAYAFIPLGFLLAGMATLTEDSGWHQAGVHAWTTGAIGLMTLAVMTRASRGHSGRPLEAPLGTTMIYLAVGLAALARIAVALLPATTMWLLPLSGLLWCLGFLSFAVLYAPILLLAPVQPK